MTRANSAAWRNSPKRSHKDVILELLKPHGARIIDIGCGRGKITRLLTELGADVVGIDPGERQLEHARAIPPVGGETFLEGIAESLPFDDQSIDIALFFNSFHHVPQTSFRAAIEEAHRVLRPQGKLYFAEPIADGPEFELSQLINDETLIRGLAYECIQSVPEQGFKTLSELTYIVESQHKNFAAFKTHSTSIDPKRDAIFEQFDKEIRELFERLSKKNKDSYGFSSPIRVNLFERL